MSDLISINNAASRGIERLRKPVWADQLDHLKIDIFGGKPGPWLHLYAPFNKECNGRDPVNMLGLEMDYNSPEFLPYEGASSDSVEYKAAQAKYEGCLAESGDPA